MSKLPSESKPRFRTIQEAEQAVLRILSTGFSVLTVGLVMIIVMASNTPGIIAALLGLAVLVVGALWMYYVSEYTADKRKCARCGKQSTVFQEEKYFKCVSCGHIEVLREG